MSTDGGIGEHLWLSVSSVFSMHSLLPSCLEIFASAEGGWRLGVSQKGMHARGLTAGGGGLNLEFGMRNLEFQHDGFTKPDRGLTPRRQGAKGFAENKKPRRGSRQGFLDKAESRKLKLEIGAASRLIHHSKFLIPNS